MSRPLSPAEIIGKARQRLADAKSGPVLDASLDRAHCAIHTLLDLRLITVFAWREAIAGVDQLAEQLAKEMEAVGGAQ